MVLLPNTRGLYKGPPYTMQEPRVCTGRLCYICYSSFKTEFEDKARQGLQYARPTLASMRRNMAIRLASPRKLSVKAGITGTSPSFLSLPTEIRLQIYRACLHTDKTVCIAGWVKGGGFHADKSWPIHMKQLLLYASGRFPTHLLLLNKRIYDEALHEIYKNLTVTVGATAYQDHVLRLKYWFTEHPMRFVSTIRFPFSIVLRKQYQGWQKPPLAPISENCKAVRVLARAPNLKRLEITLVLEVVYQPPADIPGLMKRFVAEPRWKRQLSAIRSELRADTQAVLIVKVEGENISDQIMLVKLERAYLRLAESLDGFLVRQSRSTDISTGIMRTCIQRLNWDNI